ncbi:hypothetical protein B7463_g6597, partial [Scytalidium lignicola]
MGKGGRIACIALPYLLSIGALVAIIFVGLGSTHKDSSTLNEIFFLRADLSNVSSTESTSFGDRLLNLASDAINGKNSSEELAAALEKAEESSELRDFYDIGLLGYCAGDKKGKEFVVDFCSKPKGGWWFNPINVWHLNVTGMPDLLPPHLQSELKTYKKVSYWMFISYTLAFAATCIELIVGFTATCSRLGSVATTVVSVFASVFILAAAVTSTAVFITLVGVFNTSLEPYGVHAHLGWRILLASWAAVILSKASTLFWLFSSCCCSGRSGNRQVTEKGVYEPVGPVTATPYLGAAGVHPGPSVPNFASGPNNTAYEPYRHA